MLDTLNFLITRLGAIGNNLVEHLQTNTVPAVLVLMVVFYGLYVVIKGTKGSIRLSYVPPMMIYLSAGLSGITAVVGTFFIKELLNISAFELTEIGLWVGLIYVLKIPFGHLVDWLGKYKGILIVAGGLAVFYSLWIDYKLLTDIESMRAIMDDKNWLFFSAVLGSLGFMWQDVVADGMTVEAVPTYKNDGTAYTEQEVKTMHIRMQTLGRVSLMGGVMLVAGLSGWLVDTTTDVTRLESFEHIYKMAFFVPILSLTALPFAWLLYSRNLKALLKKGIEKAEAKLMLDAKGGERTPFDWKLMGGSAVYISIAGFLGALPVLAHKGVIEVNTFIQFLLTWKEEVIFLVSFSIIGSLMLYMLKKFDKKQRGIFLSIMVIIFVFRAMPGIGPGAGWWQIDVLGFDPNFLGTLSQTSAFIAVVAMFKLSGVMERKSISYIYAFITIVGTILYLPSIAMYYGFHEWTMANFGFGAKSIAFVDTALAAPISQLMMIPLLAWTANSAPANMKATFFAVTASCSNLALSVSDMMTKYLNDPDFGFTITREQYEMVDGVKRIITQGDYSQLGTMMWITTLSGLILPLLVIYLTRRWRLKRGYTDAVY